MSKLFREIIAQLPTDPTVLVQLPKTGKHIDLTTLCREWLHYESAGARLRMAHRCAEWDGWEESLVDSILGPEEFEHEWYEGGCVAANDDNDDDILGDWAVDSARVQDEDDEDEGKEEEPLPPKSKILPPMGVRLSRVMKISSKFPMLQEKEQVLNTTGDICGGRGGELGRRLEAWLSVNGDGDMDNES